jgi:hypothetical protein
LAKKPGPWLELQDLEAEYYLLNPSALEDEIRFEATDIVKGHRLPVLEQVLVDADLKGKTVEDRLKEVGISSPSLSDYSKEAVKLLRDYKVLADRLTTIEEKMPTDGAGVRRFLALRDEQTVAYFAALNALVDLEFRFKDQTPPQEEPNIA